jgi:hypothetical protein
MKRHWLIWLLTTAKKKKSFGGCLTGFSNAGSRFILKISNQDCQGHKKNDHRR